MRIEIVENPREGRGFKYPIVCLNCLKYSTVYINLRSSGDNSLLATLCKGCLCDMIKAINKTILDSCKRPRDEI